jgi:predicted nuclease of restriction endonuclease-like RecB superfamily
MFIKGIPKSEETKDKLRKKALQRIPTRIGAILTQQTKDKISKTLLKYFKKNPDKIRKGNKCHFFGKSSPHGKHINYSNIWMKSGWEEAFAKWCDRNNIGWVYEPKTFDLGDTTYTPDFYLPGTYKYIEIKGFWRTDAKKKFKLFKKQYPNILIIVLNSKLLKHLGVL